MSRSHAPFQICMLLYAQNTDQRSLATELRTLLVSGMSHHPGFIRAQILLCDDRRHIIEQCFWAHQEDYLAYRQSADGQRGALWLQPYQPQTFHLHPFVQIEGDA